LDLNYSSYHPYIFIYFLKEKAASKKEPQLSFFGGVDGVP